MSAGNWCTIESDPGVFTELIRQIGVEQVQVEELYSLDQPLHDLQYQSSLVAPIYGLIFLFKYTGGDSKEESTGENLGSDMPGLFFAHQVIQNACATQAILSILMNVPGLKLGQELTQFKEFTEELPAEMKGLAISNSDTIRTVHNSFAKNAMFHMEETRAAKDEEGEDLFHFVSYIPFAGCLYELDGLKSAPVNHGPYEGDWTEAMKPAIQKRIEQFASTEIRFNLMAVMKDREAVFQEQLLKNQQQLQTVPSLTDVQRQQLQSDNARLQEEIQVQQQLKSRYKKENVRRRHNFLPLIIKCLDLLAQKGALKAKFPNLG